jgi:N-hydroxyarylamine O-acetyltransferase
MLVRVDLPEGPHLVDVGFGGLTLTGVLALEPDVEQATPHEPFRLQPDGDSFLMQAKLGETWQSLYRFDLTPQHPIDYELANWYVSRHPSSPFVHGILAARPAPDRRYALGGQALSVYHLDGRTERRELATPTELMTALEEQFLLDLAGLPDLEAALKRLF